MAKIRGKRMMVALLALLLLGSFGAYALEPNPETSMVYSWIANDFDGQEGEWGIGNQVPHEVAAMFVTPDGTAYTNCDWEENGHNFAEIKDGVITNIGWGTHGWGYEGGLAVTANDKYVFYAQRSENEGGNLYNSMPTQYPPTGYNWQGVQRRLREDIQVGAPFEGGTGRNGDNGQQIRYSFKPVMELPLKSYTYITGMAASNEKLFVSSLKANKIWVFDAETMEELAVWEVDSPNTLVLDKNGVLWVNQKSTNKIISYDQDGKKLPGEIAFEEGVKAFAMCIDNQNRLMISDMGPKEWIMVYDNLDSTPTYSHSIGAEGGIYSGVPGEIGDMKFYHITGIGVDAEDNLYVANGGNYYLYDDTRTYSKENLFVETGGTYIECYDKDGKKLWDLKGLNFVDDLTPDPNDEAFVYGDVNKYGMDYTKSPGQEWSYEAFTVNPHKYPDDTRIQYGDTAFSVATQVVTIQGQKMLLTSDMGASLLAVYRYNKTTDGEVAIPCALINRATNGTWPPNRPQNTPYLWVDDNGDGQMDADEYRTLPGDFGAEGRNWYMDKKGNLYRANNTTRSVLSLPFKGFNKHGAMDWDISKYKSISVTDEFPEGETRRLYYEDETDAMYIMVQTPHPNLGWLEGGQNLIVYDNWSDDAKRTVRYKVEMPLMSKTTNAETKMAPVGMSVAGDYVFVGYNFKTLTYVLDKMTGEVYDVILPPEEHGNAWALVDTCFSYRSQKLSNGDYIIFIEDDLKSKNFMVRWRDKGGVHNYNEDKALAVAMDNRQLVFTDQDPMIIDDRTMVPMRYIFETLGASVSWDARTQTVVGKTGNKSIYLTIDSNKATVNGTEVELDVPAQIVNDRTMVPLRVVAEGLGVEVEWHPEEQLVNINTGGAVYEGYAGTTKLN